MKTLPVTKVRIHIFAWLAFITYEQLSVLPFSNWHFGNFWDELIHYIFHISLFYFNAHIVLPEAINQSKKSYVLYFFLLIAQVLACIVFEYLILYSFSYLQIPLIPRFVNNTTYITSGTIRALYFIALSTAYWLALSTLQNKKRIAELEKAYLRDQISRRTLEAAIIGTENAYLKSQINPHFLFNTLNFLYNSVSKFSVKIADSFMSLSEIMHYALAEVESDGKVPLESEIENIRNFIKLNQDRFGQRLAIHFSMNGDIECHRIIPLALMTLVENVFKYGDLFDVSSPANITLTADKVCIFFTTENKKKEHRYEESHGIGIKNLENRLAAYHRYKLDTEDTAEMYKSALWIWR